MKFLKILIAVMAGLAALAPLEVAARPDISTDASFKSKYIGSSGSVFEKEPVAQPSLTVSDRGASGCVAANVNLEKGVTEIDYMAGYDKSVKKWNFGAGLGLYDLKDYDTNMWDAWASVSRSALLNPSVKFNKNFSAGDFDNSGGSYLEASVSHKFKGKIPSFVKVSSQFNHRYFTPDSGISLARAEVGVPLNCKGVSIMPKVRVQRAVDRTNFKDDADFSVSASYSF
ncbi:MAG: hypothetical protein KKC19_00455 [Nanoarchaeota archaeon]|nr:hypothetical protein [Nanoarchaeota archaeon]